MPRISYQLYCSRNFPPVADTMKMLAEAGFAEVEGYGGLLGDPDALKAALDASGLKMTSCHVGLDMLESDPEGTAAMLRDLGVEKAFVPYLMPDARPSDTAGWIEFAQRLDAAGQVLRDAGFIFGWHNHDFEFVATPQGDLPQDIIANVSDGMMLELDLGWVLRAGHDPVEWIEKFAGKIATVHIKDIAPSGEATDEDGWADVGHGVQDWAAIHVALQAAGVDHYVIEHDNPNDDARFASRSIATLKSL